jgi:hypothetical protein
VAHFVLELSGMCLESAAIGELARELANLMVAIDASMVRVRRAIPDDHPLGEELRTVDASFARSVGLARKLVVAVRDPRQCETEESATR